MTSLPPPFGVCVSVPGEKVDRALDRLGQEGLRDARYRVRSEGERVLIPVRDGEQALEVVPDGRLVETELEHDPRRPPIEIVRERLADRLDPDERAALPEGWTRLGEVLVLRVPDELVDEAEAIARAYAEVLDARSVLHLEGSTGPWREPDTRLLWGEEDTRTVHREHGIAYELDPQQVMFSPGNKTERHRLREQVGPGETIVDLFAGIGYFALPFAAEGARVVACEANPTAAGYLRANVDRNDVADRVDVREGDCRQVAPADRADRVHMGYLPGTEAYLATAREALAPEGGTIHYHDAAPRPDPVATAEQRVREHEALAEAEVHLEEARVVKTLDPRRMHVVLDLAVTPP